MQVTPLILDSHYMNINYFDLNNDDSIKGVAFSRDGTKLFT